MGGHQQDTWSGVNEEDMMCSMHVHQVCVKSKIRHIMQLQTLIPTDETPEAGMHVTLTCNNTSQQGVSMANCLKAWYVVATGTGGENRQ